ncbi:hypothetical protein P7C70_g9001, partial [Phenoliferia sp. Uapishka_3]
MPVQVVVMGICLTLLSILLIHLLFTVRYHLPLSKMNYAFQTTAVTLCLARIIAEIGILMQILSKQPKEWPYEFLYIEVTIRPSSWTQTDYGAWLFLQGLSNLAVHATHIQFLTMLFPSNLEARLILGFLGPLALMSSFLTFTALSSVGAVQDLGDAIRNTANSTLTLLYTLAIFIWGLTLNRSRAWRTDGGTAAFGIIALILGVTGTAVNFVEVKEDRMRWLPDIISCVLVWQSWMGFWWRERLGRERKVVVTELSGSRSSAREGMGAGASETSRRRRPATNFVEAPPEEIEMNNLRPHGPPSSTSSNSTPPPAHTILSPFSVSYT